MIKTFFCVLRRRYVVVVVYKIISNTNYFNDNEKLKLKLKNNCNSKWDNIKKKKLN